MFFVFGISSKEKNLHLNQITVCPGCEAYGRLEAFMVYSHLSIFFIPIFKWNKRYYIKGSCCKKAYAMDRNLGQAIERGEQVSIHPSDLQPISNQGAIASHCANCHFPIDPSFEYCPKCGNKQ